MAARAPVSQREPLIGQFVGDFLVVALLGKGGFGKVLLGLQRPLLRLKAAIKLLEIRQEVDAVMGERMARKFESEAAALAVLHHPNIVRLLQYGSFQQRAFIAMEYVPGSRTLQTEINRFVVSRAGLDPDTIKHILTQVLNGLEAAHEQDIIHRDIKPENIMLQVVVGDSWHVKLVDFGLAKVVSESRETSVVLGTVHYMAPEQVEAKNLGPWTDLYAVAAIAFELMTGHRAFAGKDVQDILRQKLSPQYDAFSRIGAHDLPPQVVEFLYKGLARYPQDRFQSTSQMRAALHGMFEAAPLTMQFSRDLSGLADSADLTDRDERRAREARRDSNAERERLELERRAIASGHVRPSSERFDNPLGAVQGAVGATSPIRRSSPMPDVALDTGTAPTIAPRLPHKRRRWPLWAGGAAAASAVGAVIALSGGTSEPADSVKVESVPPPPALAAAPAQAPEPAAPDVVAELPEPANDATATPEVVVVSSVTVEIRSIPTKARVFIDGQPVGVAPFRLESEVGAKHEIALEAPGYVRLSHPLEVTKELTHLDLTLTRKATRPQPPGPASKPKPFYIDE